ncbi:membrane protein of unknown function [Methanocaldococcus lauensis]|nr:membrane protein of unknown function [Methanocaldococcus lauensis]
MHTSNKNISYFLIFGILFILLSYFVIILQIYYGLTNTLSLIFNTFLIIFGIIFNTLIMSLFRLKERVLNDKNLLIIYLVFIIVTANIFDWIIRLIMNYFNIIRWIVWRNFSFFYLFGDRMNTLQMIILILIYALLLPWIVNYIILKNRKINFIQSLTYLDKILGNKEKLILIIVGGILVGIIVYEYILNKFIVILIVGGIVIFISDYIFKKYIIDKNLSWWR